MDMPFAYLLSCSERGLGDFALATLGRISEMRKARRELEDRIVELEATSQLIEWLSAHTAERERLLCMNFLQKSFQFKGDPSGEAFALAGAHDRHSANAG
jgi:hypothetical protein